MKDVCEKRKTRNKDAVVKGHGKTADGNRSQDPPFIGGSCVKGGFFRCAVDDLQPSLSGIVNSQVTYHIRPFPAIILPLSDTTDKALSLMSVEELQL